MKLMLALLMLLAVRVDALVLPVTTAEPATDFEKIGNWLKGQKPRAGTMLDLNGDVHGVAYLRGVSLGGGGLALNEPGVACYADFNFGATFGKGEPTRFLLATMVHPSALSNAFWRHLPFKDRVKLPLLPEIEIGPSIALPMPRRAWVLKESIGLIAAVSF